MFEELIKTLEKLKIEVDKYLDNLKNMPNPINLDIDNTFIENLDLSERVTNALQYNGIFTIGELLKARLDILPRIGSKTIKEINEALQKKGFKK